MHHLTFLDRDTFPSSISFKRPQFAHTWQSFATTAPKNISSHLKNTTIAITNKVVIDNNLLSLCPNLKYIAVAATGVNNIDLTACKERGIVVANVTGYATHSVAEHVFMLMLALNKKLKNYTQALNSGQWQKSEQFCFFLGDGINTLRGKTLGLIGTGQIAIAVAKLAEAFGMHAVFHSPSGRKTINGHDCITLNSLLMKSDVVSVHCPLTQDTQQLINTQTLKLMKPSALLINTARGPIVDECAVVNALKMQQLGGAALDVLTQEPPAIDSDIMQALNHPNLIITPHIAWASQSAMQALADQLIKKIEDYVAGKTNINLAL